MRPTLVMAQNPSISDLIEERVYPIVDSIKGFFGSFGYVGFLITNLLFLSVVVDDELLFETDMHI